MRNTVEYSSGQLIKVALNILDDTVVMRSTAEEAKARAAIAQAYLFAAELRYKGV